MGSPEEGNEEMTQQKRDVGVYFAEKKCSLHMNLRADLAESNNHIATGFLVSPK